MLGHEVDATRSEQTCEIWKIMKPPAETGFTLTLLYALPFLAVKFFFPYLWNLAADKQILPLQKASGWTSFLLSFVQTNLRTGLAPDQSGPALLIATLLYVRLARLYRAVAVDLRTTSSVSK